MMLVNEGKKRKRSYRVQTVQQAKDIASKFLVDIELDKVITFGLPEIDDRYDIWRVPLKGQNREAIGEVVVDAKTSLVYEDKTTKKEILEARLLGRKTDSACLKKKDNTPKISTLRNTIGMGDSQELISMMPNESVDLIFTSPPYFNARPEYTDYIAYEEYLLKMRKVIHSCHRVLNEGRFFVINIAPVLIRRSSRSESSRRIAVPFDLHRIFTEEGFDFIDDIIWEKPEGAGWATGRGRRFAADRNPLQYKTVPVTEYILVYRKHTDHLIDWHIRKHPDQDAVARSKISDDYERTNIWKIKPAHSKKHPAIFPDELAEKVIRYYSFVNDVVMDPFGGIGTAARVAHRLNRRFVLFEWNKKYMDVLKESLTSWFFDEGTDIQWINTDPVSVNGALF